MSQIYRGFTIDYIPGTPKPWKIWTAGNLKIFSTDTEKECYNFIDKIKREERAAREH